MEVGGRQAGVETAPRLALVDVLGEGSELCEFHVAGQMLSDTSNSV